MDSTYGFVEAWIAKKLNVEYLDYPLESGNSVAAVDQLCFQTVLNTVTKLWEDFSDRDPGLQPIMSIQWLWV